MPQRQDKNKPVNTVEKVEKGLKIGPVGKMLRFLQIDFVAKENHKPVRI